MQSVHSVYEAHDIQSTLASSLLFLGVVPCRHQPIVSDIVEENYLRALASML